MRRLVLLGLLLSTACAAPPARVEEAPPPEPAASESPVAPAEPVSDPRDAAPPSVPVPDGEGRFLVVRRQSAEPRETNPFITDDGMEMVANVFQDDRRGAEPIYETLELAGMDVAMSGGHGVEGIYVPHEHAERARRLLERLPGAQIWMRAPDGTMSIAYEVPPLPDSANSAELVAGLLRPAPPEANGKEPLPLAGPDERRVTELLRVAAIQASVMPRHGTLSIYAPKGRAEDARMLLRHVEGAVSVKPGDSLPDANLVVFPSQTPLRHDPDRGEYVHIAHYSSLDETCHAKVYGVLDRLRIPALGVGNAGGESVSVPEADLAHARRVLWSVPGAQRPWKQGDEVVQDDRFGRFVVVGTDAELPERIPDWHFRHVHLTEVPFMEPGRRGAIGYALYVAGFNTSGSAEWVDDTLLIRFSVPEAEAPAARRLLELLDL